MWRSMRWECNGINLTFGDDRRDLLFMDFGSFNAATASGVFDSRSAPGVDGSIVYSATLSALQIHLDSVVFAFNGASRKRPVETVADEYVKILCDAFNPKTPGRLHYKNNNGEWFVDARPQSFPVFGQYFGGSIPFSVDLVAEQPYWLSEVENIVNVGVSSKCISAPLTPPITTGSIVSLETTIVNQTLYDIFPIIRFWPGNACPMLKNAKTGKTITLNHGISKGFYVDVDTSPYKNTVTLYRLNETNGCYEAIANTTHWITVNSSPNFYIVPGPNKLIASQISENANPAVTIYWRERSPGV